MTPKERFIAALNKEKPDRLPVTTHHVMPSFLKKYLEGASVQEFFQQFGLDPINWVMAYDYSGERGQYFDPGHVEMGFLEARRVVSDNWQVRIENVYSSGYPAQRFSIITPAKTLSMILQADQHSTWIRERLIKEKSDIEIIARYMTYPRCRVEEINRAADEFGDNGLIRGHIMAFEGFGQPGCW